MPSTRLATITLNGTLDRVILVSNWAPGTIRNAEHVLTGPGGKGVNVARTALALGSDVVATGVVAGQCGQWICSLLDQEGIPQRFFSLPEGESRISTILVDPPSGQTTVVNDLGPTVSAEMWPRIRSHLIHAVEGYTWVVLAGASLPGLPDTVYADLCQEIRSRGGWVCLDARDQWLSHALAVRPYLVKCNQYELADIVGHSVCTLEQACAAAMEWVAQGIARVVVTLGADGAIAAQEQGAWHIRAPQVDAVYPIGSGDAMMAGLIVALDRGDALPQAVHYGVALGAANTLCPGSGCCDWAVVPELQRRATLRAL